MVHPDQRDKPYPREEHELYINPAPLLVPRAARKENEFLEFELSQDTSFPEQGTYRSGKLNWNVFNIHQEMAAGQWYWRFRTVDQDGRTAGWSKVYSFTVTGKEPVFVTPVSYTHLSESDLNAFRNQTSPDIFPNVNWVDEGTRSMGENNQLNLLVRGGGSKLRYMGLFDYKNDFGLLNEKYTEYTDRYKSQIRSYDMRLRMNIDVDLTSSTQMQFGIVGVLNESKRPDETIGTIFENLYKVPSAAFPIKTSNDLWGSNLLHKMNPLAVIADQGYYQTNWRKLEANMRILSLIHI